MIMLSLQPMLQAMILPCMTKMLTNWCAEANMSQAREQEGDDRDDLVSAPKMVLQVRL
jgi:hypothetical protein